MTSIVVRKWDRTQYFLEHKAAPLSLDLVEVQQLTVFVQWLHKALSDTVKTSVISVLLSSLQIQKRHVAVWTSLFKKLQASWTHTGWCIYSSTFLKDIEKKNQLFFFLKLHLVCTYSYTHTHTQTRVPSFFVRCGAQLVGSHLTESTKAVIDRSDKS